MTASASETSIKHPLVAVLVLWAALFATASICLFLLNRNSLRIIQWLEYVEASRYSKAQVLYREAEKRATKAIGKLAVDAGSSVTLEVSDPDLSAALSLIERALEMDPRKPFLPEMEQHYTLEGDLWGAGGRRPEQLVAYGKASLASGSADIARKYAEEAAKLGGGPDPSLLTAEVLRGQGSIAEALTILENVAEEHTDHGEVLALYAITQAESGQTTSAIASYRRALQVRPDDLRTIKAYAQLLVSLNHLSEAAQVYEKGLKSGWDDGNYLHLYGDVLRDRGNYERAVEILTQAAKVEPSSGDIELSLARAYQAQGRTRYANRHLQRAIALKPALQGVVLN